MKINNFSRHIFWSYKSDADLPNEVVIKQVATYGDIDDIIKLVNIFSKKVILSVLNQINNEKRVNLIKKIFLQ